MALEMVEAYFHEQHLAKKRQLSAFVGEGEKERETFLPGGCLCNPARPPACWTRALGRILEKEQFGLHPAVVGHAKTPP